MSLATYVTGHIMSLATYVTGHICHWPHVSLATYVTGHICHWPHMSLSTYVTGHICHWPHISLATLCHWPHMSLATYAQRHLSVGLTLILSFVYFSSIFLNVKSFHCAIKHFCMRCNMRERPLPHMQTVKALISLHIQTIWRGSLLSAYRFITYWRIYFEPAM